MTAVHPSPAEAETPEFGSTAWWDLSATAAGEWADKVSQGRPGISRPVSITEMDRDDTGVSASLEFRNPVQSAHTSLAPTLLQSLPGAKRVTITPAGDAMRFTVHVRVEDPEVDDTRIDRVADSAEAIPVGQYPTGEVATVDMALIPRLLIDGPSNQWRTRVTHSLVAGLIGRGAHLFIASDPSEKSYAWAERATVRVADSETGLLAMIDDVDAEVARRLEEDRAHDRTVFVVDEMLHLLRPEAIPEFYPSSTVGEVSYYVRDARDRENTKLMAQVKLNRISRDGEKVGVHIVIADSRPGPALPVLDVASFEKMAVGQHAAWSVFRNETQAQATAPLLDVRGQVWHAPASNHRRPLAFMPWALTYAELESAFDATP